MPDIPHMPDIPRMPDIAYTDIRHTDIVYDIPDKSYQTWALCYPLRDSNQCPTYSIREAGAEINLKL